MNSTPRRTATLRCLAAAAMLVVVPAGPQQPAPETLDEVLVSGQKPITDREVLLRWLPRLIGAFDVPNGSSRADCLGIQGATAPAVHCDLPILSATMLFGHSTEDGVPVIRHLLVDGKGMAEGASGILVSPDVMVSRAACLNGPPGCERITRITAGPDQQQVRLEFAIVIDQRTTERLDLVLQRRPAND